MFKIRHIDHVVIRVADLEGMVRFYENVLGLSLDKRRDDLGLVHLRAGSCLIDLISVDGKLGQEGGMAPAREGRNLEHLCLRIEPFDFAELAAHFADWGLELGRVYENYGAEGNGPSVYIKDPEGNAIELKGPPSGA
jgi:catechol 2,3-dioxygenase-like lactoylglutathione lyase family enzyme